MSRAAGSQFLFCLRVPDPLTFLGVCLFLVVALALAPGPARRAFSADPGVALGAT
jgi:hypothetical protein